MVILNKGVGRGLGVHGLCWGLTLTWGAQGGKRASWAHLGLLCVKQAAPLRTSASIGTPCAVESRPWDESQREEGQLTT